MEQPEFYYDEFGFRVDKEGTIKFVMCDLTADLGEDSSYSDSHCAPVTSGLWMLLHLRVMLI